MGWFLSCPLVCQVPCCKAWWRSTVPSCLIFLWQTVSCSRLPSPCHAHGGVSLQMSITFSHTPLFLISLFGGEHKGAGSDRLSSAFSLFLHFSRKPPRSTTPSFPAESQIYKEPPTLGPFAPFLLVEASNSSLAHILNSNLKLDLILHTGNIQPKHSPLLLLSRHILSCTFELASSLISSGTLPLCFGTLPRVLGIIFLIPNNSGTSRQGLGQHGRQGTPASCQPMLFFLLQSHRFRHP
ncbi:hypothetical protein V8F33_001473 [Rhypophila sp. PSN 637]